ncbi:MAG: hypothetical protein AAF823_14820 [Planctomycetota bacterium]
MSEPYAVSLVVEPPGVAVDAPGDLPAVDVRQLARLTDDTGVMQHGVYATPDPNHGYCVDDNARALIAAVMLHEHAPGRMGELAHERYLQFVVYAFDGPTRRFRNFMGYDRRWLEEVGSTDSQARAFWSLGVAAARHPDPEARALSADVLGRALEDVSGFGSPRSKAFVMLGLLEWMAGGVAPDAAVALLERYGNELAWLFQQHAAEGWHWFEPIAAYDNARLCEAMVRAGARLARAGFVELGLGTLRWLIDVQTHERGHLSVIGNDGWLVRGGSAERYDQQPLEAQALIEAAWAARSATGDEGWAMAAAWAYAWFHGRNDAGCSLIIESNGGCGDGLTREGVNRNQGAESTLAYVTSTLAMHAGAGGDAG